MKIEQHFDVMDIISDEALLVEAEIYLIDTEKGGRKAPVTARYSPNHNFADEENKIFYIGNIEFEEGEWLYPGESKNLIVNFMNVQGLRELLIINRKWRIQEASHLVGYGIIKRIINK